MKRLVTFIGNVLGGAGAGVISSTKTLSGGKYKKVLRGVTKIEKETISGLVGCAAHDS